MQRRSQAILGRGPWAKRSFKPGYGWMEKAPPGLESWELECSFEMRVCTWKSGQISVNGAVNLINFNMRNLIAMIYFWSLTHLPVMWTSRCAHSHSSEEHRWDGRKGDGGRRLDTAQVARNAKRFASTETEESDWTHLSSSKFLWSEASKY